MNDENKINFFAGCTLEQIHDWYLKLADKISNFTGGQSTAPRLLKFYLTPKIQLAEDKLIQKSKIIHFCKEKISEQFKTKKDDDGNKIQESNHFGAGTNEDAGVYILGDDYINTIKKYTDYRYVMKNTMLPIFLSESKKFGKSKGIISKILEEKKDEYLLSWYTTCTLPKSTKLILQGKVKLLSSNISDSDKELFDIYVGLNVFTIRAEVVIAIKKNGWIYKVQKTTGTDSLQKPAEVIISIKSWKNTLVDYYDFDANLGFPLPNPHYGQSGGIHPEVRVVDISKYKLNHNYLIEMIDSKPQLANPFYVYKEFSETDPDLLIQNKKIKI